MVAVPVFSPYWKISLRRKSGKPFTYFGKNFEELRKFNNLLKEDAKGA